MNPRSKADHIMMTKNPTGCRVSDRGLSPAHKAMGKLFAVRLLLIAARPLKPLLHKLLLLGHPWGALGKAR